MLRIATVVGETSGDILGSGLIDACRARVPGIVFEGIAGERMGARGCRVLHDASDLAVMGYADALDRLPRLLALRWRLARRWIADPPDVFVGIDAPDFNLPLEARVRAAGVPVVHYVSPSLWAWRTWRVPRVRRAVDLLLVLFPFEEPFYRAREVPVRYVGHPLADRYPAVPDRDAARQRLGLAREDVVVALLPGSRDQELARHTALFARTAADVKRGCPAVRFLAPLVSASHRASFERAMLREGIETDCRIGEVQAILTAADAALVASGTATLDALLAGCPMVVTWRTSPVNWAILRRLLRVPHVSLPNLLADEALVSERLQDDAESTQLAGDLLALLDDPKRREHLQSRFAEIGARLRQGADERAAEAVLEIAQRHIPAPGLKR